MWHPDPNHYVDITDHIDAKLRALRAHVSQTSHDPELEQRVRTRTEATALRGGLGTGRHAEAFKVVATA